MKITYPFQTQNATYNLINKAIIVTDTCLLKEKKKKKWYIKYS